MKESFEMTAEELVQKFINHMVYDCHGIVIRFERSWAMKELVRRGKAVLGTVAKYLSQPLEKRESSEELDWAFCYLLNLIGIHHLKNELKEAPDSLKDVAGWTSWAEKHKAS